MSLSSVLTEIEEDLEESKQLVEKKGVPLSEPDCATFNSLMDSANTNAVTAMADPYYQGLDEPTELPASGGQTPYTDLLANCGAQIKEKYDTATDKQGQLDRLFTITQKFDDAKDEVD